MPFSEKKGRFLVSITEPCSKPSPSASPPPSAASPSNGSARAVKRGRFLVSCLPCNKPCLAPTMSCDPEEVAGLFPRSQGSPRQLTASTQASTSRSTCSSYDAHVTAMDNAGTGCAEVSSLCRDSCPAGQGVPPAQSPERPRVRFSDTAEATTVGTPSASTQQQQQQQAPLTQAKRQFEDSWVHTQLKPTRSYCKGRFTIQEAVAVQGGGLHRSKSAPECVHVANAGQLSTGSIFQAGVPFAAGPCGGGGGSDAGTSYSSSSSTFSNSSSSCFAHVGPSSCAELLAANQLMSGLPQLPLQQGAASTAHQLFIPAATSSYAAPVGLYPTASVPVPGSCCQDEDSSMYAALVSFSDHCPMSDASPFMVAPGTSSADSSRHSSSNGRQRSHMLGSSSSCNMLSSFCSVGAGELMASAAAAMSHHHSAPKRSPSISYFRRGRFLVQTTMV